MQERFPSFWVSNVDVHNFLQTAEGEVALVKFGGRHRIVEIFITNFKRFGKLKAKVFKQMFIEGRVVCFWTALMITARILQGK